MRILLVSDFVFPVRGGLEVYVANLAAELTERGHEVHIATLTEAPDPQPGVQIHSVRSWSSRLISHSDPERRFALPVSDPGSRAGLNRVVRSVRPDIVHAHTWLGWSLRSTPEVPLVATVHDFAPICQLRTLWRPEGVVCTGPGYLDCMRCGAGSLGWPRSIGLASATLLGRRSMGPAAVMVLSECVRDTLQPYFGLPVEVIPGFVRTPPSSAGAPPELPAGQFAMFAGDPGRHKGLDLLLDIWRTDPPEGVELLVATTRATAGPVVPGVHYLGLRPAQMSLAWSRATVALMPSRWKEAFGLSAIEALTAGTPVIAADNGALPELVKSGKNGFVISPEDPQGWIEAIRSVARDRDLRARLSEGARTSSARWRPSVVIPRIEGVYRRVLDQAEVRAGGGG